MGIFSRYTSLSDEDLMRLFQSKKDERAFAELYRRYSKKLLGFLFRMLNSDEALAQDKLHDIFARIVERPHLFDAKRSFKTWLFQVAANESRKHYREKQLSSIEEMAVHEFSSGNQVLKRLNEKLFNRELQRELQALSYVHRTTFILRYQEQVGIREIAEIMDCSEGTVKSRCFYCLKILAEKLSAYKPQEI